MTTTKPYRIGTDYLPANGGKIKANTRGPIRNRTITTTLPTTALPVREDHERTALALARKIAGDAATVRMASTNGSTKYDWEVLVP